MISKNRDWFPDNQQQIRLVSDGGYRFISLYAVGNEVSRTKQGINEKGFAVVS
ncbi:MAG: peptidase acyl-coenzyme A:6-aminopenicillanic acid acyl-transferase [Firmicutes bacterium]|nr:peptidase acyl-coenzyme A:6-aminopenicillanic acid acyl-transferase [Bacillota bacterium]